VNYQRTDQELIDRLRARLKLLREDVTNLRKDSDYAARVATDLRALVVTTRTNHPLLLELAVKYGDKLEYETDAPPHMPQIATLEQTLNGMYQAKYEGKYIHSVIDLIKTVADKEGAHEDPEFSEEHIETKSEDISVGGYPVYIYQLILIGELVVQVGHRFLENIDTQRQK
jgi:hypothetical protein